MEVSVCCWGTAEMIVLASDLSVDLISNTLSFVSRCRFSRRTIVDGLAFVQTQI